MAKKKIEMTIDDIIEKIYYFTKDKLGFDDIQAVVFIASIFLIPFSMYFVLFYTQLKMFHVTLYITLGLDLLVVIYSIVKFKYFKNKRIFFTRQLENKTIEVKNIEDVNSLNPIEFEFFVKELFIYKGYKAWTTKRTYDNGADVVAEKNNERIAIQVKHSTKSINGYAVYQALRGKYNYKAEKAILVTNNEMTNQAKLDAIRNGVELIDAHEISLFLRKSRSIKIRYMK